jgi:tetratricopeptide (TPR) repeat protein
VGWLWYVITLLPVIGLVPGGIQFFADRYTYVSQIGLYVAVVWAAADFTKSWPHRAWARGIASAAVLSGLLLATWFQTTYWRDSEALWRHTIACTSLNDFAQEKLGEVLQSSGRSGEAVQHFELALRISPKFLSALHNLADIRLEQGKIDEAIELFQQAVKANPKFAEPYYNLGNARIRQGKFDDAIACYEKALQLEPSHLWAYNNLANALVQKGEPDKAVMYLKKALAMNPDFAAANYNLANALTSRGKYDEAIHHYEKALQSQPDYLDARTNLLLVLNHVAWSLATAPQASLRDGAKAVRLARRAAEISDARNPEILGTLAAAYAEAGRFTQAADAARAATELASRQGKKQLADALGQRLKLYQSGVPFRDQSLGTEN